MSPFRLMLGCNSQIAQVLDGIARDSGSRLLDDVGQPVDGVEPCLFSKKDSLGQYFFILTISQFCHLNNRDILFPDSSL